MSDETFDRIYNTVMITLIAFALACLAVVGYDYYFDGPIEDPSGEMMP